MGFKGILLICGALVCDVMLAQGVFVPSGFEGPIFFDFNGQLLKNQTGANVFRIYRISGVEDETKMNQLSANNRGGSTTIKNIEKSEYLYFEDHYITGEIQTQGNMWVTKQHKEQGVSVFSWKVHLKGECRWYHKNGQLAQIGIYDGADWYGEQKHYNTEGKLIKTDFGKTLDQYNYIFERNVLKRPNFTYSTKEPSDILPKPLGAEEESPMVIAEEKPINLAAKMASIPRFSIKNYRPYLGLYEGKTTNLTLKKVTNTNLDITEFITKEGKVMMDIHWYGSFSAYTELAGSINDNVIFAQGDWFVKGVKTGVITLAAFLKEEDGKMEGFFNVRLFDGDGKVQSCSFELQK